MGFGLYFLIMAGVIFLFNCIYDRLSPSSHWYPFDVIGGS